MCVCVCVEVSDMLYFFTDYHQGSDFKSCKKLHSLESEVKSVAHPASSPAIQGKIKALSRNCMKLHEWRWLSEKANSKAIRPLDGGQEGSLASGR